jgi:hypothetical protein
MADVSGGSNLAPAAQPAARQNWPFVMFPHHANSWW